MKNVSRVKLFKVTAVVAGLSLLLTMFTNCDSTGGLKANGRKPDAAPSTDSSTSILPPISNTPTDISVIANTKTMAVYSAGRILNSMVSCLGTKEPSSRSLATYRDKLGSFSLDGKVTSVTAPMAMAAASLAGEVCTDLVQGERALPAAQRRFFNEVNFAQGPNSVADAALERSIRKIARSCWGRMETSEELGMIRESARTNFNVATVPATELQLIYVCAAMVSALPGLTN